MTLEQVCVQMVMSQMKKFNLDEVLLSDFEMARMPDDLTLSTHRCHARLAYVLTISPKTKELVCNSAKTN